MNVTDLSTLASNTLIKQVLREEKCQLEEKSTVALFAKQVKNPEGPSCQGMSETRDVLHPSTHGAPMNLRNRHSRGYSDLQNC